jgi:hypothetical protein
MDEKLETIKNDLGNFPDDTYFDKGTGQPYFVQSGANFTHAVKIIDKLLIYIEKINNK